MSPVGSRVRLTRDGVAVATFTAALAVVAWVGAGAAVNLVVAGLIALLLVEVVAGAWNMAGLELTRRAPVELFAGEPADGAFEVRRSRRGLSVALQVQDDVEPGAWAAVDGVPGGAARTVVASWRFERRGCVALDGVTLSSSYPFGLVERRRSFSCPAEVWVWPRPRVGGRLGADASGATARRTPSPDEIDDLRPYRPGDRLRDLHAPTTARTGVPHVVVRRGHADPAVWVDVPDDGGAAREVCIESAAGAVIEAVAAGRPVGLRAAGRSWSPRTGLQWQRKLLSILAELPA